jgi:sugar (pentulose or hexulose) kinase
MRFDFPLKKEKGKSFLALDFGDSGVKALIFEKDQKKRKVLGFGFFNYDRFLVLDSRDFEKDLILKTAKKTVGEAKRISKKDFDFAF